MAKHQLGTGTSYFYQNTSCSVDVLQIKVNHNGGMGGGSETFYCEDTFDVCGLGDLFCITTIIGNEVYINKNWISTIKKKKMVKVFCDGRNNTTIHYYVMDRGDDYELVGTKCGNLEKLNMKS